MLRKFLFGFGVCVALIGAAVAQNTTIIGSNSSTTIGTITNDTTTNATRYPVFSSATSGTSTPYVSSSKLNYNPSTGTLTATGGVNVGGTTLATYSSGTWTCGISFGDGTTGITYTGQNCLYTKVGRVVTISGGIALSNKGSSTGNAKITGLPYTTATGTFNQYSYSTPVASSAALTVTAMPFVGTVTTGSATTLDIYTQSATGTTALLTDAAFANNTQIYFSMTYLATTE